ncbi:amino acid permease [Kurthia massiliensis]|uniref:amino acid permease n=1 Tax=Kurthia massiliensis TaxID=1033739 RepID=UPI000289D69D|nr:amino acid permease [Kurthia massiliensis]
MTNSLFRKKSIAAFKAHDQGQLTQTLGAFDLMLLGVGAIVGTGIFILPGTIAAEHAGPGIVFSFIIAAIVCAFAAMCYSEFASAIPVTGSAYTYSYVVFGEFIAWLIGWSLVLEYGLAVAAVSTGWSAYFVSFLEGFNIHLPKVLTGSFNLDAGTYINLPAIIIIFLIAMMLTKGVKESARLNTIMVFIKVGVVLLFIIVGAFYVKPDNWAPFTPFGFSGVLSGAALVFFAFLGFDAVSSAAEEVKKPQRNMPLGIIGSLAICTVLYVLVSLVLTGMVPYTDLNVGNPVSFAMSIVHLDWVSGFISLGAIVGMTTVILVMLYGSTRLSYSFARDGLLPKVMSDIDEKHHTPVKNTWITAVIIAICAGFIPLDQLAALVNMGTLLAFTVVSLGVLFLRKRKDLPKDRFKVPFFPIVPIISFILCIFLITQLTPYTWIAAAIWIVIGIIIYFLYGRKHSSLNQ